jgi:hypothetical protein
VRERKVVFGARLVEVPEVNAHPNFPVLISWVPELWVRLPELVEEDSLPVTSTGKQAG